MARRITGGLALLAALAVAVMLVSVSGTTTGLILIGASPRAVAVDEHSGHVFVATAEGVTALDGNSDRTLYSVKLDVQPWTVLVDTHVGHVIVIGYHGTAILDATTGAIVHADHVGYAQAAVALNERTDQVFVVNGFDPYSNGTMNVLDVRRGIARRSISVGYAPSAVAVDATSGRVFVANTSDDSVSVIDARTLTVRSTTTVARSPVGIAIDKRDQRVFVASSGVNVCARPSPCSSGLGVLNAKTGTALRNQPLAMSPVAVAVDERTGHIFLANGTADNYGHPVGISNISMLDASGHILRTVPVAVSIGSAVMTIDMQHGRAVVTSQGAIDNSGSFNGPGHAYILDTRRGTLLRSIQVGVAPVSVAVDQRTGRAFVVNAGGVVATSSSGNWFPSWLNHWLPFLPSGVPRTHVVPGSVSVFDVNK